MRRAHLEIVQERFTTLRHRFFGHRDASDHGTCLSANTPSALIRSVEAKLSREASIVINPRGLQRELRALAVALRGASVTGSEAVFARAFPELGALLRNVFRTRRELAEKLRGLASQVERTRRPPAHRLSETRETLRVLSANLEKEVELFHAARLCDVAA